MSSESQQYAEIDSVESSPASTASSYFHSLIESTYASIEAERATRPTQCRCEPWAIRERKRMCPDIRTCEYVKNVQALHQLREQSWRKVAFGCWDASDDATTATSSTSASSPPSHHFTMRIPQSSFTLNDGVGWVSSGGGDATGAILWPASVLTCKMINAMLAWRRQMRNQSGSTSGAASLPFFDSHPLTTLEIGCGSGLVTQYLSLISHLDSHHYASDQVTGVVSDMQKRVGITVNQGHATSQDELGTQEDTQPTDPAFAALSSSLHTRLQRFHILPYEWGTPLLTTPSLTSIRDTHVPQLILGADLLYFSISFPKLVNTVWELFENVLWANGTAADGKERVLKEWNGRSARRRGKPTATSTSSEPSSSVATAASSPSSTSSSTFTPPLLLLTHKSRHLETEQDFFLAISQFTQIWRVKQEFIHGLQIGATDGTAGSADVNGDSSWRLVDPLPRDCTDPHLQCFFIMPKYDDINDSTAASTTATTSTNASQLDSTIVTSTGTMHSNIDSWTSLLQQAARDFIPAPAVDTDSQSTHWLMRHFPRGMIESWRPMEIKSATETDASK